MFELIQSARFHATRAEGRAQVSADWPPIADHFAGAPVLPGSIQIELCAQIAGPLAERAVTAQHGAERWAFLGMVRNAVFQHLVPLPATLELRAELKRVETALVTVQVEARVGDEQACRAELVMMLLEAEPTWERALAEARARVARWEQS